MAKMERKMTSCAGEVTSPDFRHELIMRFSELSDSDYQRYEWSRAGEAGDPDRTFESHFELFFEFMEDHRVFYYVEQKKIPYEHIGPYLKTKQEAKALYNVAENMLRLPFNGTNAEYLSSPYLPKLRESAKEAFNKFMANEQEDKEFCERVEHFKKERAAIVVAESSRQSHQESNNKGTVDDYPPLNFEHFHLTPELLRSLEDACARRNIDPVVQLFKQCGWEIDKSVLDKIPAHLKVEGAKLDNCVYFERPRGGVRFRHLENDSVIKIEDGMHILQACRVVIDEVRIMQGNPNAYWLIQQKDHVQVVTSGKMLNRDGKALEKKPDDQSSVNHNTCIPLTEWLEWKHWNRKY